MLHPPPPMMHFELVDLRTEVTDTANQDLEALQPCDTGGTLLVYRYLQKVPRQNGRGQPDQQTGCTAESAARSRWGPWSREPEHERP